MEYVRKGNKKYRINSKYYILYHKELPKDGDCAFYTNLKDIDNETEKNHLVINENKYVLTDKLEDNRILGYLQTDEPNLYVGIIVKKGLVPLWLISFLCGCSFWLLPTIIGVLAITGGIIIGSILDKDSGRVDFGVPATEKESTGDEDKVPYDSEVNVDVGNQKSTIIDMIIYEGDYLDIFPSDTVPFGNCPENEGIYLQYVVKDLSGKELYVSDKFYPGESINWSPTKYLEEGIQELVITVNVYHIDTNMQDVGTDMHVKFNIHK